MLRRFCNLRDRAALILMPDDGIFIAGTVIRAVVKGILNEVAHFVLIQILLADGIAKFLVIGKIHAVVTFRHEAIRLLCCR